MIKLLDNMYLTADSRQFMLYENIPAKTGKKAGEMIPSNFRYFPTLDFLFTVMFEKLLFKELDKKDVDTFENLKERYHELAVQVEVVSKKVGNCKGLYAKMVSEEEIIL